MKKRLLPPIPRTDPVVRFKRLSSQGEPQECWVWKKPMKSGYGRLFVPTEYGRGTYVLAHRMAWEIHVGMIPAGLQVNHRCDNPACVNPSHLYLGTQKENMIDRFTRNRANKPVGERQGFAKLNSAQVKRIRGSEKSIAELVKDFNVSRGCISHIIHRKTWKHI